MKKIYKRLISCLLIIILCFGTYMFDTKADAYVSVSATSSVSIGGNVSVSISISGDVSAYTLYVSYKSDILQYNSGSGAMINGGGGTLVVSGTAAGTVNLSFTAKANGESNITVSGEAFNIQSEEVNVSFGSASVRVETQNNNNNNPDDDNTQEPDDRSSNCNLSSLQVSPGKLVPDFSKDVYEYTVRVDADVKEIAISAVTDDSKASTSVHGNTELEQGKNEVQIIVTAENGAVKKYILTVIAGDILEDVIIKIDDVDYTFVNSTENIQIPENFTSTIIKYKEWDITAYESPNKKITLVCLKDKYDYTGWFIYDKVRDEFTEYKEYSSRFNRYIILPFPDNVLLSSDFKQDKVNIFGNPVEAYRFPGTEYKNKYLIYGMNIEGNEGYYIYDDEEKTFMRYLMGEVATPMEPVATPIDVVKGNENVSFFQYIRDFLSWNILFYIMCGTLGLLLIFIIVIIILGCKNSKLHKKLDEYSEGKCNHIDEKLPVGEPELAATEEEQMPIATEEISKEEEQNSIATEKICEDEEQNPIATEEISEEKEQMPIATEEISKEEEQNPIATEEISEEKEQMPIATETPDMDTTGDDSGQILTNISKSYKKPQFEDVDIWGTDDGKAIPTLDVNLYKNEPYDPEKDSAFSLIFDEDNK